MKKLALLLLLTVIFQIIVISQGCLPDGILFTSQTEIDNFPSIYPGCNVIEGQVVISVETPVKLTTPGRFNLTTCAGPK